MRVLGSILAVLLLAGEAVSVSETTRPPVHGRAEKGAIRILVAGEVQNAGFHYITSPSLHRFFADDKPGILRTSGEKVRITRKRNGETEVFEMKIRDLSPQKDFTLRDDDILVVPHAYP